MFRIFVLALVTVFSWPALAENECADFRAALALSKGAARAYREFDGPHFRDWKPSPEALAVNAALDKSAKALDAAARALRETVNDPAAVAVLAALDAADRGADRVWRSLLAWYDGGKREAGAELIGRVELAAAVDTTAQGFLVTLCRERGH